jgi:hypothetical protein
MAAGQHNPSRRALLGAAVGIPLLGAADARGPLHHASHGPPPRSGEEWQAALAAFEEAQAAVRGIEAATAGCGYEEEEALLPVPDAACDAAGAALGRLLLAPVPDLAAFAAKLELFFEHELEPHSVDRKVVAAIREDGRRLTAMA